VVDAWRTLEAVKALPLPAPPSTDFEALAAGVVAASPTARHRTW
jgi:hypothetical protein